MRFGFLHFHFWVMQPFWACKRSAKWKSPKSSLPSPTENTEFDLYVSSLAFQFLLFIFPSLQCFSVPSVACGFFFHLFLIRSLVCRYKVFVLPHVFISSFRLLLSPSMFIRVRLCCLSVFLCVRSYSSVSLRLLSCLLMSHLGMFLGFVSAFWCALNFCLSSLVATFFPSWLVFFVPFSFVSRVSAFGFQPKL